MNADVSRHVPVLPAEVVEWLVPRPGMILVDGTLGGGGHTRMLLDRVLPDGRVIAIDRDPAAIRRAQQGFASLPVTCVAGNYRDLPDILGELAIPLVDGILLDLGLSSDQLDDAERGFSYAVDGPLDLRFDPDQGEPAWRLLQRLPEKELADLIYELGEERFSRRVARRIVEFRKTQRLETANQLAELVRRCVPRSPHHRIDPATRTFQALRIAVNDELGALDEALARIPDLLRSGGRVAIISFHSLEDRRVKHSFRNDPRLSVLTKKPVRPTDSEVDSNPRARSARLRVAERR